MARSKLSKSKWILYFLFSVGLLGGYISWLAHLEKDTREEVREWTVGLLFPAIVGGGGYWLNQQAEKRSGKEKNEEREQSELKDYFDRISTLVVENELTKNNEENEQYQIARAFTANILRELTAERMNQVIFFLASLSLLGRSIQTQEEGLWSKVEQLKPLKRSVSLLRGVDLSNAELKGLKGWNIDLSRAKLSEANLSEANLWRANLWRATLWRANLSEANLKEADLRETNLKRAKLSEANLSEADLREADLSGADLWKASLKKTKLSRHLTEDQQKQCAFYDPIIVESESN